MYKKFDPKNRHEYESEFYKLIAKITGVEVLELNEGCVFENDVFKVEPYRSLSCTCGLYDEIHATDHEETCLLNTIGAIDDYYKKFEENSKVKKIAILKKTSVLYDLCKKFHRAYDKNEPLNMCTCKLYEKWKELKKENHGANCDLLLPNFWFKSDDIKIQWYKRFFRKATINKFVNIEEFRKIIGTCLRSI